MKMRIK